MNAQVTEKAKVLIAISGDEESLVTAWLLKKQGMQLRAVYFDLTGLSTKEEVEERVQKVEKKLGLAIQIIHCSDEIKKIMRDELAQSIEHNRRYSLQHVFHLHYLFPKLFQLKAAYQFQKIATGHRSVLQPQSVDNITRVYRYQDLDEDESRLLVGLESEQISNMELPLGSIPRSMIEKIARELDIANEVASFKVDWKALQKGIIRDLNVLPGDRLDVMTTEGRPLGFQVNLTELRIGDQLENPGEPNTVYWIESFDIRDRKVVVVRKEKRVVRELHLEDASWFTMQDLKMGSIRCTMTWGARVKAFPVRLMQFEGHRLKAFLETPLKGDDADIFSGEVVLWLSGAEVLGGARVLAVL